MKILHKYVLKEHLGPLVFSLTTLTSLLLLNYIAKRFGDLVGKGLEWSVIAKFFGLSIPFMVALTLPMAVLVATLYAFSRLAAENEITALKASGVSLRAILAPVLIAGVGVMVFMVIFNDQIMPRSNHGLAKLQMDIAQKKPTFALREQVINDVQPGRLYLRANHIEEGSNLMREVTIYDLGNPTSRRTIFADSGTLEMAPNQSDLLMTLYEGEMQDVPTDNTAQLQRLFFKTDVIVVRGVANQFSQDSGATSKGEREMTVCEMQQQVNRLESDYNISRRSFARNLYLARAIKAKVSPRLLAMDTMPRSDRSLGGSYCKMLRAVGLGALIPAEDSTLMPYDPFEGLPYGNPHSYSAPPGYGSTPTPVPIPPNVTVDSNGIPIAIPVDSNGLHGEQIVDSNQSTDSSQSQASNNPSNQPPQQLSRQLPGSRINGARMPQLPVINDGLLESDWLMMSQRQFDIVKYDVEIHKKFALAVACFVFALLGAPIALRFPRGGVGMTIGVSLIIFAIYYVGLIAGSSLAVAGHIPAWISMWAANVIFAIVALYLLSRMGKEGSTARGGDAAEMIDNMKQSFGRRFRSNKLVPQEKERA